MPPSVLTPLLVPFIMLYTLQNMALKLHRVFRFLVTIRLNCLSAVLHPDPRQSSRRSPGLVGAFWDRTLYVLGTRITKGTEKNEEERKQEEKQRSDIIIITIIIHDSFVSADEEPDL